MGRKELQGREIWQDISGAKATKAEQNLYQIFSEAFVGTKYKLHKKPAHLKKLYAQVDLHPEVLDQIFNPEIDLAKTSWGVSPDFAIENIETHKLLFGEIKRQDGWVEGKNPSAGRGNAHERLCKLFTPGLLKAYREIGNIRDGNILPFWVVFQGDITRDPKRVREITFWFDGYSDNFFMWRPNMSGELLLAHFNSKLKHYLD
ncbi:MunI family type II restriction endonuclease [Christensenellaceae bacterium OttesenSCG-928-K19]|nr:MunI family type II restriction endonuclease [Christensenellaceae bacterium OttesenSCG-928-K19]